MDAVALLKELATEAGVPEASFNDHGVCRIVFDEKLELDFEWLPAEGLLFLHAPVMSFTGRPEGSVCQALLEANLFGRDTGGAVLALDAVHNEVILCERLVPELMDSAYFRSRVESFLNVLERWQEKARSLAAAAPAVSRPDAAGKTYRAGTDNFLRV